MPCVVVRIRRRQGGFTLIEMLIVVAIVAIGAAIAVPNLLDARKRAKDARAAADTAQIVSITQVYINDTGQVPPPGDYSGLWNGSSGVIYMPQTFDPWGAPGAAYQYSTNGATGETKAWSIGQNANDDSTGQVLLSGDDVGYSSIYGGRS